tara:strand:- start:2999 stop:3253 length:255 start_codon:yes stop_codon:yes gene_type:complete
MKFFKSRFRWINLLICRWFGCAMTHVSAMAFEEGHREPEEIMLICPRCDQAHCHEWPHSGQLIGLEDVDVEFSADFNVDRKTLH